MRIVWLIPIGWLIAWWLVQAIAVGVSLEMLWVLRPLNVGTALVPLAVLMWQGNKLRLWLLRRSRGQE
jgi:hypothetical protein